jgi:hypothetical protein
LRRLSRAQTLGTLYGRHQRGEAAFDTGLAACALWCDDAASAHHGPCFSSRGAVMPLPVGPFETLDTPGGERVPLYLVPFDKKGRCEGPQTLAHVLSEIDSGRFTDVHIFSHGWNNVFKEALGLYREFFSEYFAQRHGAGLDDQSYKPLLIGILWPATALVSESEQGPRIAGDALPEIRDAALAEDQFAMRELAAEIADADVARFHELITRENALTREEALELATILLPVLGRDGEAADDPRQQVTPERIVKAWQMTSSAAGGTSPGPGTGGPGALPGGPGTLPGGTGRASAGPQTAGFLDAFNPKEILRKTTVYLMKDRAGTVGAHGVGPMLTRILEIGKARVHLTGHSYGAKVVLSALTVPDHGGRKVRSVLLLQPAVNHLCFAANVDGRVGGYRPALERSERPIYTTFSSRDSALAKFFHLAVRRDGDLAEQRIAAAPSQFAALGGFGPGGLKDGELRTLDLLDPGNRYPAPDASHRVFALDGSADRITGHGDVRNAFTEWALVDLTL